MIALLSFLLAVLASPFRSKGTLLAENALLRHQVVVLRRKVKGGIPRTSGDRWFFMQPVLRSTIAKLDDTYGIVARRQSRRGPRRLRLFYPQRNAAKAAELRTLPTRSFI